MANAYYPGNQITLTATFRNAESGALEDPDTVTLYIKAHKGTEITIDMGDLTNDSVGVWSYVYIVPLDTSPDTYCYGFYGEDGLGDPYAYTEKRFRIKDKCAIE